VLNAGRSGAPGSLLEVDPDGFADVHRVNVLGSLVTARAAIRPLLERKGALVAVSSVAGLRAAPDSVAYCSSKAALVMLAQCIAVDHGPAGVRANVVCPGWTRTPMGDRAMAGLAGGPDGPQAEQTHTPTAVVTALAERFGGEVPGLTVTRPTLEDVYLTMIGKGGAA